MKEGWEYKKLGEVTTKICDGSHNPPKGVEHSNYLMLSSKNIFFDRFDYDSPRYLSEGGFIEENKRTNISDGDVLLTIVGTVGRTCCVTKPFIPFTLQRSVAVLKPQKTIITSRFLMYSLHSLSNIWESEAKGVAQKGVYLKQVSNISIPIPTITEQNDIVSELDLLSGVIEKQKAQLEELDKLAQSIFYDMFGDPVTNEKGWKIIKLESLLSNLRYGTGTPPQFSSQGYKFIRATNIKGGYVCEENMLFISREEAAKIEKCKLQKNDMIIVRSGVNAGDVCRISDDYVDQYAGYDIIITINSMLANTMFLNILMNNRDYVDTFIKPLTRRAAQSHLNAQQVKSLCIPLPPIPLQQEFAAKVEAIEAMKAKVRLSLKEAETLFNERMEYYFN